MCIRPVLESIDSNCKPLPNDSKATTPSNELKATNPSYNTAVGIAGATLEDIFNFGRNAESQKDGGSSIVGSIINDKNTVESMMSWQDYSILPMFMLLIGISVSAIVAFKVSLIYQLYL